MSAAEPPSVVLVVDLRDADQLRDVLSRPFDDIQADYLTAARIDEADVRRTLLIARVEDLESRKYQLACERIVSLGWTRVICLVVGGELDERRVLSRPGSLRTSGVGILWIGDARGVPLRLGSVQPGTTVVGRPSDPYGAAMLPLRRVLEIPGVFDEVLEAVEDMPDQAANPGLALVVDRVRPDLLSDAWLRAVTAMVGDLRDAPRPGARPDSFGPVLDGLAGRGAVDGAAGVIRPDGRLAVVAEACERSARRGRSDMDRLARPAGWFGVESPLRSVRARLAAVGTDLEDYRRLVSEAFIALDELSTSGPTAGEALTLRHGIRLDPAPEDRPRQVVQELRAFVERGLAAGHRLRDLADALNGLGGRIEPQGSQARMTEIDRACPRSLIDRLHRPARLPVVPADGQVLMGIGLGAAGAAAAGSVGRGLAALVVIVVTALSLAILRSGLRRPGNNALQFLRPLSPSIGAAVVGAGAGIYVGSVAAPAPVVAALCGGAGAALLLLAAVRWWYLVLLRWRRESGIDDAGPAVTALSSLLRRVAVEEWTLAQARRAAADRTRLLAAVLDTMADRLADAVSTESGRPDPWWSDESPPHSGQASGNGGGQRVLVDVEAIVRDDLAAAVEDALGQLWTQLERGAYDDAVDMVGNRLRTTLGEYDEHLRRNGIQQRPPFAPVASRRQSLVEDTWHESALLSTVFQMWRPGAALTQMCDWSQIRHLDMTRGIERYVRFAPEAARQAVVAHTRQLQSWEPIVQALDSVQWLGLGYMAGVVRLVPLRPAAVATRWLDEEEPGDGSEGARGWDTADFARPDRLDPSDAFTTAFGGWAGDDSDREGPRASDPVGARTADGSPEEDWAADDYSPSERGWLADDWDDGDGSDDGAAYFAEAPADPAPVQTAPQVSEPPPVRTDPGRTVRDWSDDDLAAEQSWAEPVWAEQSWEQGWIDEVGPEPGGPTESAGSGVAGLQDLGADTSAPRLADGLDGWFRDSVSAASADDGGSWADDAWSEVGAKRADGEDGEWSSTDWPVGDRDGRAEPGESAERDWSSDDWTQDGAL